jgi:hypothetical protein
VVIWRRAGRSVSCARSGDESQNSIHAVFVAALSLAGNAGAQSAGAERLVVFVVAAAGSFGDDEGSLGGGFVGGGGAGVRLVDGVQVEAAVTTTRHSQLAAISWEGRPTVATARVLYLFGVPSSRSRAFAGAGFGAGHYAGTRTDTIYDSPREPPRLERVAFDVNGLATEAGGGVEIGFGARVLLRLEAWLLMMGGERTQGLEPTFVIPRARVSAGMRF